MNVVERRRGNNDSRTTQWETVFKTCVFKETFKPRNLDEKRA